MSTKLKTLSQIDEIAFAELLDLCRDDARPTFPANGSFFLQKRSNREYWYYRGYERTADGSPGKATLTYVGPAGDANAEQAAAQHIKLHADYKKRSDLTSRLRRAGLPAPSPIKGAVTAALADAGLFRAGSILIGSVAFQTFGALLGAKFSNATYRTQVSDIARPTSLKVTTTTNPADILATLKNIDPSFAPKFHRDQTNLILGFSNLENFKIEFLAPERDPGFRWGRQQAF
jgi:hypothetical protein